jgi:hypothetical protein
VTLDVTLTSLAASGADSGLVLTNTAGTFTVNGTGTTDGSGGTIANSTADGVQLSNVAGVSLKNMNINANAWCGIFGNTVSALTMTNCALGNNGHFLNAGGRSYVGGVYLQELTGSCTFDGNDIFTSYQNNMTVENFATGTTLTATIQNSTFRDITSPGGSDGLIIIAGESSPSVTAPNVAATVDNCTFTNNLASGMSTVFDGAAVANITLKNSHFTRNYIDVNFAAGESADHTVSMTNNVITEAGDTNDVGPIVNVFSGDGENVDLTATVNGNTITGRGAAFVGDGLRLAHDSVTDAVLEANANTITSIGQGHGVTVEVDGTSNNVALTMLTNTSTVVGAGLPYNAIIVRAYMQMHECLNISGNQPTTAAGADGGYGIRLAILDNPTIALQGYAGGDNAATVATFLSAQNNGCTTEVDNVAAATFTTGTCATP